MSPKISIIVPVYKVEAYIHKCIQSILSQTFTDFELILVDDGSPDNCGIICDKYASSDNRVKVIHKENGGLSDARNAGINIARGKYIGFVDSDDYINEKMYELLYSTAEECGSDLVVCDFIKVNGNQDLVINSIHTNYISKHYSNIEALNLLYKSENGTDDLIGRNSLKWIIACNKLYKRNLFSNNKYIEGKMFEDEYIAHRILYSCTKVSSIPVPLYYYVHREDSITNSEFSIKKFDRVGAFKDRGDFFKEKKQKDLYNKALKSYMDVFFWYYYKAKLELSSTDKELNDLKKIFNRNAVFLFKNPFISWKQKIMILVFVLTPEIFECYRNIKEKNLLKTTIKNQIN